MNRHCPLCRRALGPGDLFDPPPPPAEPEPEAGDEEAEGQGEPAPNEPSSKIHALLGVLRQCAEQEAPGERPVKAVVFSQVCSNPPLQSSRGACRVCGHAREHTQNRWAWGWPGSTCKP